MNPLDQPCQATSAGDLRQQILDSRVPKNEREWWASREIEKLERELTETERQRFGADADRRRLRAEVERWKTVATQMTAEREHNANQAGRLRAEVEQLNLELEANKLKGGGCQCSDDEACVHVRRAEKAEAELAKRDSEYLRGTAMVAESASVWQSRAEKAEAELADWSVLNLWGGTPEIVHKFIKGQQTRIHHCQDLEAELITERARLDWLEANPEAVKASSVFKSSFGRKVWWYSGGGNYDTARAAIDASMKNESNTP
jgi:hypothetical protein